MRIVVPTDGSASAETALRLVAGIRWPEGSQVDLVGVLDPYPPMVAVVPGASEERDLADLREILDRDAATLRDAGIATTVVALLGKPSDEIVRRATTTGADLIVMGSRGHSGLARVVLGSVSAAVIDHAPCPVLVARRTRLDRVVLAEDGSDGAGAAGAIAASWPIFGQATVDVVSVVDIGLPLSAAAEAPLVTSVAEDWYIDALEAERARVRRIAHERARILRPHVGAANAIVREGDAATELIDVATRTNADLLLVGSRGLTGIARLFAGSVARRVLTAAPCSVLVVRGFAYLPDRIARPALRPAVAV